MPENLTAKSVKTLPDGVYTDKATAGLRFIVSNNGRNRKWAFRRRVGDRRFDVGLGSAATVTLDKARLAALQLTVMSGDDFLAYLEEKHKKPAELTEKARTFREVSEAYMRWNIEIGNWEELSKSHRVFESRMRCHVWPAIGSMALDAIQPVHMAVIAKKNWERPDVVNRCLQFTRSVFDWAKAQGWLKGDNPADRRGALKYLLPRTKHIKQNRGALSVKDLPPFFAASMKESQTVSRQCLEFSILTATRSLTAREARWEQIDFEKEVWTIPPSQLKVSENGALIVPLAPEVIAFLRGISDRPHDGLIFPNTKGRVLSDSIVSRGVQTTPGNWLDHAETLKRGVEVRPTQHGIARATFRTWAQDDELGNDKRFDARTAELCLHHKIADAYNGAYERNQSFIRRREMMAAWARYCFSQCQPNLRCEPQASD